jgi:hypothetical protein
VGDGEEEAVAVAREGFDVAGTVSSVIKSCTEFMEGYSHAVLEVDIGTVWPKFLAKFFAGDDFASVFKEEDEECEGLVLEPKLDAFAEEDSLRDVHLIDTEPQPFRPIDRAQYARSFCGLSAIVKKDALPDETNLWQGFWVCNKNRRVFGRICSRAMNFRRGRKLVDQAESEMISKLLCFVRCIHRRRSGGITGNTEVSR